MQNKKKYVIIYIEKRKGIIKFAPNSPLYEQEIVFVKMLGEQFTRFVLLLVNPNETENLEKRIIRPRFLYCSKMR